MPMRLTDTISTLHKIIIFVLSLAFIVLNVSHLLSFHISWFMNQTHEYSFVISTVSFVPLYIDTVLLLTSVEMRVPQLIPNTLNNLTSHINK